MKRLLPWYSSAFYLQHTIVRRRNMFSVSREVCTGGIRDILAP